MASPDVAGVSDSEEQELKRASIAAARRKRVLCMVGLGVEVGRTA